jgi:hypothetical protein
MQSLLRITVLESSCSADNSDCFTITYLSKTRGNFSEVTVKFSGAEMTRLDNGSGNDDVNLASNENSFKGEFQIQSLLVRTKLSAE